MGNMRNMRGFALFIVIAMNRVQVIKSYQNTNLVYPPANKVTQTIFFLTGKYRKGK